jgi:HD-GYP domain-containing protein (c-di-GMP phosphodiesterase class II)
MAEAIDVQVFSNDVYLAVPTASLLQYKTALADVYVRLPTDRMVKLTRKGEPLEMDRITRLGAKDVKQLYVLKQDFTEVVNELIQGASAHGQKQVSVDAKMARFFSVAESVYSELLNLPLTDDSFSRTISVTSEISTLMQQKPDFPKLLAAVVGLGDDFSRHSLGTVVMANMLMVALEWNNRKLVEPVTMGAFFHDIGMKEIPEELRRKSRVDMTKDEVTVWEGHVGAGIHILNSVSFIPAEVLRIVQEHHEVPNGTGFPARLRGERIFPMAKVVSFANVLAHDIFDQNQSGHAFSVDNLLKKIEFVYNVLYGQEFAKAASRIFKKTP